MSSNPNFDVYGPIARQAAKSAGVPESIFLSLINSESSFNPYAYNQSGASGIAQFMPDTAKEMGVDPFNPYTALEASAKYLKKGYEKYGSWQGAIAQYKGYGNKPNDPTGQELVTKVLQDALNIYGGEAVDQIPGLTKKESQTWNENQRIVKAKVSSDPLWKWSFADWKNAFANSAYGFMLGFVGVIMIIGSIWFLLKGNRETIIAATATSINPLK